MIRAKIISNWHLIRYSQLLLVLISITEYHVIYIKLFVFMDLLNWPPHSGPGVILTTSKKTQTNEKQKNRALTGAFPSCSDHPLS